MCRACGLPEHFPAKCAAVRRRKCDRTKESKAIPFCRNGMASACECDRVDVPAVVRLLAMRGAAIGIELRRIAIGAEAEVLHLRDACALQAIDHVARQIEHR